MLLGEIQSCRFWWWRTHPVRRQRQPQALQLASWLAEAEVVLFRFGDDEVELNIFSEQQVSEGEGVQRWLVRLNDNERKALFVCSADHFSCCLCADLVSGVEAQVLMTLFTVMVGVEGCILRELDPGCPSAQVHFLLPHWASFRPQRRNEEIIT